MQKNKAVEAVEAVIRERKSCASRAEQLVIDQKEGGRMWILLIILFPFFVLLELLKHK